MKHVIWAVGCSALATGRASQLQLRGQSVDPLSSEGFDEPHLHLDKFEQKVLRMAERKGPTAMDDIATMIDTKLLPEIQTAHDTAKAELVTIMDAFKACQPPDLAAGTLKSLVDARTGKQDAMTTCRTDEARLETVKTNCNNVLATLKSAMDAACGAMKAVEQDPSSAKSVCDPSSGMTYETWLGHNKAWFDAKHTEYMDLKQKCESATAAHSAQEATCATETSKWTAARNACNTAQDAVETAYCSVNNELTTSCTTFETCFSRAMTTYNTRVPIIKKEEERRKVNYRVLKRMACLIPLLKDGSAQADIDACKAKVHDTSAFNLVYQSPAAKQTCPAAGPLPCDAAFTTAVYGSLPSNAAADTCTPCQGVADYQYVVIVDYKVALQTSDLEAAKAELNKYPAGASTPRRLIAAFKDGVLDTDPHTIGPNDADQGGGVASGFNKWWMDWNDINRMLDVAKAGFQAPTTTTVAPQPNYQYVVVVNYAVALQTPDLEVAKAELNKYPAGASTPRRLIAAFKDGVVDTDPHYIGPNNAYQGGGVAAGFNKWWMDWNDINRMLDVAKTGFQAR